MNPHKGFSLLEILVAFAILAVSLSLVLRIFSTGVNSAILSEEYGTATQLAEALLATAGVETPLVAGEKSGEVSDKYHWQVTVTPMASHAMPKQTDQAVLSDSEPVLMAVEVEVSWSDDDDKAPRSVELSTLKLVQVSRDVP
jgi:general secretion pathway protein I